MGEKNYTGSSLEAALASGTFEQAMIELTGMVKASQKKGNVSFTRGECENWVDVPTALIDKAVHVGQRPCKEHVHPLFKITFKKPKDADAQVFAALLAASGSDALQAGPLSVQGWQGGAMTQGWQGGAMAQVRPGPGRPGPGGPGMGIVIPLPFGCIAYCYENWDGRVFCGHVC